MRYSQDHKESTRRRVIDVAAARFRKEGIDAVGVASLMADAGLTHGGFYNHFPSKEALVARVFDEGMGENFRRWKEVTDVGGIEALINFYLRPEHRDHPERGCPAAALGPDVARHSRKARAAFARKLEGFVSHIESLLPKRDRVKALAIFSTLVGSLQLSRAVVDVALSDQLLEAGRSAALALIKS